MYQIAENRSFKLEVINKKTVNIEKKIYELSSLYKSIFSEPPYNEDFDMDELINSFTKQLESNTIILLKVLDITQGFILLEHGINCHVLSQTITKELNNIDFDIKNSIYIADVGVSKNVRGKGFGKKLMNYIIANYGSKNPLYLRTGKYNNEKTIRFYEKLGFENVNIEEDVENLRTDGTISDDKRIYMIREMDNHINSVT